MLFSPRVVCLLLAVCVLPGSAAEADAVAISETIAARHMPYGTILDPFLDAEGNVTGYTRCGDSALWTGYYLAAESYRYKVTKDPQAFANVYRALDGILELIRVTGTGLLARCYVPKDSPFAEGMLNEEKHSGIHEGTCLGQPCWWIGNTSRDQYIGAAFGLAVAAEMADVDFVKTHIRNISILLLSKLMNDDWAVRMPDGSASTVFWQRPDQKLALLLAGRVAAPDYFSRPYSRARTFEGLLVVPPVAIDVAEPHESYFKFNLLAASFFHLLRQEPDGFYGNRYSDAYAVFRRTVDDHGNAFFNMVDRAVRGPNERRDAETRDLLDRWLLRPRTDLWIDNRERYQQCGENRACAAIPVEDRPRTDFLWQRSPFQMWGGLYGTIEGAGIDYTLPYWMARHYGVVE